MRDCASLREQVKILARTLESVTIHFTVLDNALTMKLCGMDSSHIAYIEVLIHSFQSWSVAEDQGPISVSTAALLCALCKVKSKAGVELTMRIETQDQFVVELTTSNESAPKLSCRTTIPQLMIIEDPPLDPLNPSLHSVQALLPASWLREFSTVLQGDFVAITVDHNALTFSCESDSVASRFSLDLGDGDAGALRVLLQDQQEQPALVRVSRRILTDSALSFCSIKACATTKLMLAFSEGQPISFVLRTLEGSVSVLIAPLVGNE